MITLIALALFVLIVMTAIGRPINTANLATDCASAAVILAIVGLVTILGLVIVVLLVGA